jgi:hypothetical protein
MPGTGFVPFLRRAEGRPSVAFARGVVYKGSGRRDRCESRASHQDTQRPAGYPGRKGNPDAWKPEPS